MRIKELENKLGLPPLKETMAFFSGDGVKNLESTLEKVNKLAESLSNLSKNTQLLDKVKELIVGLQEMDRQGTIYRMSTLLQDIKYLSESPKIGELLKRIDSLMDITKETS